MKARSSRRRLSRALSAVLLSGLLASAGTAFADSPRLQLPAYEEITLDNGLILLVMEHRAVPLVSMEMWIDAGAALDPRGKEGLASLTAESLRKGAGDRDAAEFAEALDFLGARAQTGVDHDSAVLSLELLASDFHEGLGMLADAVLRPRFDAAEIDKLTAQMADDVRQSKDNPRFVLSDYHRAFQYGDHPYGSPADGSETSLSALGVEDVKSFYRDHYGADRAILAVVGDLGTRDVVRAVEAALGDMGAASAARTSLPAVAAAPETRVRLVNKPDTPQTWFMIGNLGPAWGDPDYAAVELVRTIFGGRFTSWLNTKLRIEAGLTYGARYHVLRAEQAGLSYISSFTATETTRAALDLALAQLTRLHEEGIGAEDLASAKAYFKGQSPYEYERGASLANTLCLVTRHGLGREFVDDLFAQVDAVSQEDCRRVIAEWFPREHLVFTAIGVASEVEDALAEFGTVSVRENDAPGFH